MCIWRAACMYCMCRDVRSPPRSVHMHICMPMHRMAKANGTLALHLFTHRPCRRQPAARRVAYGGCVTWQHATLLHIWLGLVRVRVIGWRTEGASHGSMLHIHAHVRSGTYIGILMDRHVHVHAHARMPAGVQPPRTTLQGHMDRHVHVHAHAHARRCAASADHAAGAD